MPTARPRAQAKRPQRHTILEHLTLRLHNDDGWKEFFSDAEQRAFIRFAKTYWALQITAGFTPDEMYRRIRAMLEGVCGSGERPV
jgi:hypothetical protein